jgi:hypothetical protein
MVDSLPREVVVTELADGVRYRLPRRQSGRFTCEGAFHLLSSLLIGVPFLSFWVWAVGSSIDWQNILRAENGLVLIFMAFGLWMLGMAAWLAVRGLLRWAGHSEIELRRGRLVGIERFGWLSWSWRRPVSGLSRLEVRDALAQTGTVRVYANVAAATQHNAIVPIWDASKGSEVKPRQLVPGYPRDWLLPLAKDLARRCQLADELEGISETAPSIDVLAEPLPNSAGFVEMFEQPSGSKIAVLQEPEKLTVSVPARWFGWGRVVFIASEGQLTAVRSGLFRTEQRRWSGQQLADIRVGCIPDSEGPDTAELHIQPYPGEGPRFRLALRHEAEARWLATLLRRAVCLGESISPAQVTSFRERPEQPAGSRIVCQESQDSVTLQVPPAGSDVKNRVLCGLIALAGAGLLAVLVHFVFNGMGLYYLFSVLGALFGLALLLDAGNRACHRVVLTASNQGLMVRESGLYGVRREQWPRRRIADVRAGDRLEGRTIHPYVRQLARDQSDPTYELQIHLRGGEVVRLLDGHEGAELQWAATVLRRTLAVPEQGE